MFVHEYSPKDIELAKRKLVDSNFISFGDEIKDEDVIAFGLAPYPAGRMGRCVSTPFYGRTVFSSM